MAAGTLVSVEQYLAEVYESDCDYVDGEIQERNWGERTHSRLQLKIAVYLSANYAALGMEIYPELRVRISASCYRIPDVCLTLGDPGEEILTKPPFLCIEVLSPEDRMNRVEIRVRDFLEMGVPYVWLLDPYTKQAYVATADEGLREVKDGVLRAGNTVEMPLAGILE